MDNYFVYISDGKPLMKNTFFCHIDLTARIKIQRNIAEKTSPAKVGLLAQNAENLRFRFIYGSPWIDLLLADFFAVQNFDHLGFPEASRVVKNLGVRPAGLCARRVRKPILAYHRSHLVEFHLAPRVVGYDYIIRQS